MEPLIVLLGWVGLYAPLALGAVGSMVGCARGGVAAAGALLEVEGGYGRFIGVSAMPSSQTIYGIVVTLSLNGAATVEGQDALAMTTANAPGIFGLGLLVGIALMASAFAQGTACAASISSSKSKPEIFGISIAPAAVVEGFAVFAFVFALVLAGGIPEVAAVAAEG